MIIINIVLENVHLIDDIVYLHVVCMPIGIVLNYIVNNLSFLQIY